MAVPENKRNPAFNRQKASLAAKNSSRPGEDCKARPGEYVPAINRNRCEGKKDCVEVCPHGVFEVRRIEDADYLELSWLGKLKSMAHGKMTAYTPARSLCQACGLCVVACPEKAITLIHHLPV